MIGRSGAQTVDQEVVGKGEGGPRGQLRCEPGDTRRRRYRNGQRTKRHERTGVAVFRRNPFIRAARHGIGHRLPIAISIAGGGMRVAIHRVHHTARKVMRLGNRRRCERHRHQSRRHAQRDQKIKQSPHHFSFPRPKANRKRAGDHDSAKTGIWSRLSEAGFIQVYFRPCCGLRLDPAQSPKNPAPAAGSISSMPRSGRVRRRNLDELGASHCSLSSILR